MRTSEDRVKARSIVRCKRNHVPQSYTKTTVLAFEGCEGQPMPWKLTRGACACGARKFLGFRV